MPSPFPPDSSFVSSLWIAISAFVLVCAVFARAAWNYFAIPTLAIHPDTTPSDCMVVIPARNEESTIARAIQSLPHDTVIVVDDHSSDRTAEAARKAGAGVVDAPDLPRGTTGKSNACLAGARLLQSKWILFADADTWFEEGFLNAAVATAEANGLALLSIHLRPRAQSALDSLLAPVAHLLYYVSLKTRTDPASAFNGQCILVRRSGYEFLGGHSAVLNSLAEDVKLAALALRHRLKLGIARAGRLGHVQFRDGWSVLYRRGYRLLLYDFATGIIALGSAAAFAWWPVATLIAALRSGWIAPLAMLLVPLILLAIWYRNAIALLAPIAVYPAALRLFAGFWNALRGARLQWKGRAV